MKDANNLREIVKFIPKQRDELLEKPVEIILDICESTLEKYTFDKETTKEVCIYFERISEDFSCFKHIKVETEKRSIKKIAKKGTNHPNSAKYLPLKFVAKYCNKYPFSLSAQQHEVDYKKFLVLSDILKERGLYCCARCDCNKMYFAVVLKLQ